MERKHCFIAVVSAKSLVGVSEAAECGFLVTKESVSGCHSLPQLMCPQWGISLMLLVIILREKENEHFSVIEIPQASIKVA